MAAHTFPAIKLSSTKVALSTLSEDLSSSFNGDQISRCILHGVSHVRVGLDIKLLTVLITVVASIGKARRAICMVRRQEKEVEP